MATVSSEIPVSIIPKSWNQWKYPENLFFIYFCIGPSVQNVLKSGNFLTTGISEHIRLLECILLLECDWRVVYNHFRWWRGQDVLVSYGVTTIWLQKGIYFHVSTTKIHFFRKIQELVRFKLKTAIKFRRYALHREVGVCGTSHRNKVHFVFALHTWINQWFRFFIPINIYQSSLTSVGQKKLIHVLPIENS